MEKFEELKAKVAEIEAEAEKFYDKGNKAAGTRLRKGLQEIKNLSQEIRINVSEMKKTEAVS
jgi:hypothetical protein|tara:strand:- start:1280 stop:1465 length:186 start_codon:yes stop_codon:yes gene_type:complete